MTENRDQPALWFEHIGEEQEHCTSKYREMTPGEIISAGVMGTFALFLLGTGLTLAFNKCSKETDSPKVECFEVSPQESLKPKM